MSSLNSIFDGKEDVIESYTKSLDNLVASNSISTNFPLVILVLLEILTTYVSLLLENDMPKNIVSLIVEASFFIFTLILMQVNRWKLQKHNDFLQHNDYFVLFCLLGLSIPKLELFLELSENPYTLIALGMNIMIYFLMLEKAVKKVYLRIAYLFVIMVYLVLKIALSNDVQATPIVQVIGVFLGGSYLVILKERTHKQLIGENVFLLEKERVWHRIIEDFPEWTFLIDHENQVVFSNTSNPESNKKMLFRMRTGVTQGKSTDPKLQPLRGVNSLKSGGKQDLIYDFFMPFWQEATTQEEEDLKTTSRDLLSDRSGWKSNRANNSTSQSKLKRYQSLKNDQNTEVLSPRNLMRKNSKKFKKWFKGLHLLTVIEMITSKMEKFKKVYGKSHLTLYATAHNIAAASISSLTRSPITAERAIEIKISVTRFQEKDSLIVVISDITQRDMVSRLEGVNEYKINLLASFSHELRTPLNANLNFLETSLEREDISPDLKEKHLLPAYRSAKHLFYIISDILDYSQFTLNKIALKFQRVYVKSLVNNVLELFAIQAAQKNLRVSAKIPEDLEINTDSTRLSQVLVALVSNAVKFTESGFICVQVSKGYESVRFDVIDSGIGINEKAASKLDNILKGNEGNNKISEESTGASLGLSVASKLAILLSPDKSGIDFKENFAGGTNFFFIVEDKKILQNQKSIVEMSLSGYLNGMSPYNQNISEQFIEHIYTKDDLALNAPRMHKVVSSGAALSGQVMETIPTLPDEATADKILFYDPPGVMDYLKKSKAKDKDELIKMISMKSTKALHIEIPEKIFSCQCEEILIVDDDGFNLLAAQRVLDTFGVPSVTAFHGKQAIEVIENKHRCCENCKLFRFVLMDINMPVMNGYEATKFLREKMHNDELPYIPIIACTAFVTHFDSKECFDCGMDDYITKPISKDKINRCLQKWTRRKTIMFLD